jgi:heptosyltransferase I
MHYPPIDPAEVRRALLVRPRFLGDVCLTLPSLDAVRSASPSARVAYLVEEGAARLLEGDPRIDELVVAPPRPSPGEWLDVVRRVRRFAPDVVLDFFCNPRTALWTALSGARVRVGYAGKGIRSSFYTRHVRPGTLSAVGFHLASVAALGWPAPETVPRLHVGDEARESAAEGLAKRKLPADARLVGFHPGARWPTRRWDPARWVGLARRFLEREPSGVALVTGGAEDRERVESIVEALPHRRAHAITGWRIDRFVALQAACSAFVCGDTGPLHTAVAAGTPTLGLMSRNRPAMFFPYPAPHRAYYARVECSPCHRDVCEDLRCLQRLGVDGAWALLAAMLRPAAATVT